MTDSAETYVEFEKSTVALSAQLEACRTSCAKLAKLRAKLGREHNHLADINRKLPAEILCSVFGHVALFPARGGIWNSAPPLLDITSVCSLWRSLALEYPALWTTIDLANMSLSYATLSCERAKPLPLTIRFRAPGVFSQQLVYSNLSNIQSLQVECDYEHSLMEQLEQLLITPTSPALHLARFSWTHRGESRVSTLRKPLFGGMTPQLRHIELKCIRMPWAHGFYLNLDTLSIHDCPLDAVGDINICHVLEDCPHLRVLDLDLRGPPLMSTPVSMSTVSLPYLQQLALKMPAAHLYRLLRSIDAHSLFDVRIDVEAVTMWELERVHELPEVFPHLRVFSRIDSFQIELKPEGGYRTSTYTGSLHGYDSAHPRNQTPRFYFTWKTQSDPVDRSLQAATVNYTILCHTAQALGRQIERLENQGLTLHGWQSIMLP